MHLQLDQILLNCSVKYLYSQQQCQEVSIASHPCQKLICVVLLKVCQFDGCEMISYGKHIEFCLAHSRVWVRVSYYFNDHIHNQYDNQYGLGTFSFVCWSLKVFYKVPLRSFSHCSTTLSFLFSFLFFDLDCVYINAEDGTRPQLKSKCLLY